MANKVSGKVVSLKMDKTVVIEVTRFFQHPLYKKKVRRTKNYKAHYEGKDLQLGQTITIVETRPISKDKHFKVVV